MTAKAPFPSLAKVGVESSNLFARSNFQTIQAFNGPSGPGSGV